MSYNEEYKVQWEQLAPMLQAKIKAKIQFNRFSKTILNYIIKQDADIRKYIDQLFNIEDQHELDRYNKAKQLIESGDQAIKTYTENWVNEIKRLIGVVDDSAGKYQKDVLNDVMRNSDKGQLLKNYRSKSTLIADDEFHCLNVCDNDADLKLCKSADLSLYKFEVPFIYALHKDTVYVYEGRAFRGKWKEYSLSRYVHCRIAMYNCFTKKYFFYVKPGVYFRMDAAVEPPAEVNENGALY